MQFKKSEDVFDSQNIDIEEIYEEYQKHQSLLKKKEREFSELVEYLSQQEIELDNLKSENLDNFSDLIVERKIENQVRIEELIKKLKIDIQDSEKTVKNFAVNKENFGKAFRGLAATLSENAKLWESENNNNNKINLMFELVEAQEDIINAMKKIRDSVFFDNEIALMSDSKDDSLRYQTTKDLQKVEYSLNPSKTELLSNQYVDYSIYSKHSKMGFSYNDFFGREKDKIAKLIEHYGNFNDVLTFFTNRGFSFLSSYRTDGFQDYEIVEKFERFYLNEVKYRQ